MSWFNIQARAGIGEISILDFIGTVTAGGLSAKVFSDELKKLGNVDQINVRINSPGGEVFAGMAIYNMLKRHKARKIVTIDGIAASMASVIAMAGDTIIMPENSMMMLHQASSGFSGAATSEEMRTQADLIDRLNLSMIGIYAARSKQSHDKVAEMMKAETWLTAKEAVAMGFADEIEQPVKMAALFDIDKIYASTPQTLKDACLWDRVIAKHDAQFYGGALR